MQEKINYAGFISKYEQKEKDPIHNVKVERINKMIDEYNDLFMTLPIVSQIDYRQTTLRMCREILIND